MNRRRPTLAVILLGAFALPSAVLAQAPGYSGPDGRQIRLEYRAEVIGQMNELMGRWAAAWSGDDIDALTDLYLEEAILFRSGAEPVRGREAIREWLGETLPDQGQAEAFLVDFDASGGMAMAQTNYRIAVRDGTAGTSQVSGDLVTILLLRGNRWRIRSQVFLEH